MSHPFDATSTADEVIDGLDLRAKRVVLTGVSSGIGAETARALVAAGATVLGTARDVGKNSAALHEAARAGRGAISLQNLDLGDLSSVEAFAAQVVAQGDPLDLVIANAGVMNMPYTRTVDGFEAQFAINYLGHFLLANRLLQVMREGARLIVLSSSGHRFSDVDLEDPNFERTPYDPTIAYGRSKTADALFAVAFDARYSDRGIRAAAVHPGNIWTELTRYVDPVQFGEAIAAMQAQHIALGNAPFEAKSPGQGASTTLWAGLRAKPDAMGGKYCEDCAVSPLLENPNVSIFTPGVLRYAVDAGRAEALWTRTQEWLGPRLAS